MFKTKRITTLKQLKVGSLLVDKDYPNSSLGILVDNLYKKYKIWSKDI